MNNSTHNNIIWTIQKITRVINERPFRIHKLIINLSLYLKILHSFNLVLILFVNIVMCRYWS